MEIKKYMTKIVSSDDNKKKEALVDWMCNILKHMDEDLEQAEIELYEIAEGKVLNEERAKHLIEAMKPYGMKWTLEETEAVKAQYGYENIRPVDFWIVMNSAYNDYNDIFKDNVEWYAKFSKDFIDDEDAKEGKVYYYFSMIPK